ncbi:MAG TPA: SpoIIE family protein phosphatase [Deinococcales bacterium]|nr:SpoIIE family protein phosphatase [Deinococcales bacterium]
MAIEPSTVEGAPPRPGQFKTLTVQGVLDSLDEIAAFVVTAAEEAGLERKAAYRLRLAVDEIATNIITHGYDEAGLSGQVWVSSYLDDHCLAITIEDEAIPYDPLNASAPDNLDAPLEERQIGGLGVFLTLRGVDEFRYEHVGGRNRNVFVMNRMREEEATGPLVVTLGGSLAPINDGLRVAGYSPRAVPSIDDAMHEVSTRDVKALLLDGNTPTSEASDLLERIAQLPLERRPAVIACTTDPGRLGGLVELFGVGVREYLAPPFDSALLRVRLEAALDKKSLSEHQDEARKQAQMALIERDVQIGRDIQLSFLPSSLPQPEGWEVAAFFQPAREVAGDFYDAFELINGRRLGFLIADVCDKGVGAALFMALMRTLVRNGAQQNVAMSWMDPAGGSITENQDWLRGDPSKRRQSLPSIGTGPLMNAIAGTNRYMTENHGMTGYFATMFFGILDHSNGSFIYINGGHNPPVLIRANGEHEFLKPTGPAVGMLPDAQFTIKQAQLFPGDTLFCYTDGCTDAKDPQGKFFTEQRLFHLMDGPAANAAATVERARAALVEHISNAPQFDDITMVCVHRQATAG